MDKYTHGEHLSQPLQTKKKQFKLVVTFSTGYKGNFNVTSKDVKFFLQHRLLMKMVSSEKLSQ